MPDYDIAVIGEGPAGSTFLRLAPKNLRIAVIDKSGVKGERPKPCGGLLSPDAQKFLARSGLTLPKEILVTPQIFAVKTVDFSTTTVRRYQRSYLNMDRQRFDGWLRSLVPERVERIAAICVGIERTQDGFKVYYRRDGVVQSLTAGYLVGADGAGSIVRRTFFKDKKIRRYVAIQRWFKEDEIAPFYSCVFDKSTSDCCSWSISKDGYMIYGGAFAPENCRASFEKQLKTAAERGFPSGKGVYDEACLVYRPKRTGEIIPGGKGILLLGEAGGFISPSSLEGISWAMRCGEYAAKAFSKESPEKEYRKLTNKLKRKLFLKILKSPFMYQPILRRIVMGSGVMSLKQHENA